MDPTTKHAFREVLSFGPFRLHPVERVLERGGSGVPLGSRAMDILIMLTERAGEVVHQRELIARAWPNVVVEDNNLRVHMASLRKALEDGQAGARYIANIPGRGYAFVAPVMPVSLVSGASGVLRDSRPVKSALPGRVIGRDNAIREVAARLLEKGFVTIVGAGGIGKTTVAVAVAERLASSFAANIFFVDLGPLSEPGLVAKTLGYTLGVARQYENVKVSIKNYLKARDAVVVFDCCEHMVDEVASLAEEIFDAAPAVRILATSREALRAAGENVYHLAPLEFPPQGSPLNVKEALQFSAIQLFADRASASIFDFQMSDVQAAMIADICRQLDGVALAIELAAGRVEAYGVGGVLDLIQDRFHLLTNGKRTAVPRHQTLQAAIDWSYSVLSERNRIILRRLSIFAAPFTFDAACAVAKDDENAFGQDLVSTFPDLIAKSLVAVVEPRSAQLYRLLDSTRHYLRIKLVESGELNQVARRHARYYQELLLGVEQLASESKPSLDLVKLSAHIANVRAALEWCFSEKEMQRAGVALAAASAPLFFELSLTEECLTWVQRALERLEAPDKGGPLELKLHTIMGLFLPVVHGHTEDARRAIVKGLELAASLADVRNRAPLLAGLYLNRVGCGYLVESHKIAYGNSSELDTTIDPPESFDWMRAVSASLAGDHDEAIRQSEKALVRLPVVRRVHAYTSFDCRVHVFGAYARSLWARGFPEKALQAVAKAIFEAESLDHPVSLSICLGWAMGPVVWAGDLSLASQLAERLVNIARQHHFRHYQSLGAGWQGAILIRSGRAGDGLARLEESFDENLAARMALIRTRFLLERAVGQSDLGRFNQALSSVDEALERCDQRGEGNLLPEAIRIKAEILFKSGESDVRVREMLLRSIEIAQEQSALSWQLQSAMSLVTMRRNLDGAHDAYKFLSETIDRFSEGFETRDLRLARSLLAESARCTSRLTRKGVQNAKFVDLKRPRG